MPGLAPGPGIGKKTGRPVRFEMTEQARQDVGDYIKAGGENPGEFLFSNRKMTNVVTLLAAPHAADATVKRLSPSMNLMFRRFRSASRPIKARSAAYAIA